MISEEDIKTYIWPSLLRGSKSIFQSFDFSSQSQNCWFIWILFDWRWSTSKGWYDNIIIWCCSTLRCPWTSNRTSLKCRWGCTWCWSWSNRQFWSTTMMPRGWRWRMWSHWRVLLFKSDSTSWRFVFIPVWWWWSWRQTTSNSNGFGGLIFFKMYRMWRTRRVNPRCTYLLFHCIFNWKKWRRILLNLCNTLLPQTTWGIKHQIG